MHLRNYLKNYSSLVLVVFGALLILILLAGCASTPSPTTAIEEPTASQESISPKDTAEIAPTEEISVTQTLEAADSNCITCHTDKEQLINTADPVEEKESESSGEG